MEKRTRGDLEPPAKRIVLARAYVSETSFSAKNGRLGELGVFQSGQMGLTVDQVSYDFGGSNPPAPTTILGLSYRWSLYARLKIWRRCFDTAGPTK